MASRSLPPRIHAPLQIAVAAVIALFFARLLHLPEAFWAPISLTPHGLISYAVAVAILGLICGLIKLHSSAFRFGAIALTVVVTSPDKAAVWLTAGTRFVDVALGILVALAVIRIWPKSEPDQDTIPTP